jgi:hypothetical protein
VLLPPLLTHWEEALQVVPALQVPQLPPQPSLPQALPEQLGVQVLPPEEPAFTTSPPVTLLIQLT